MRQADSESMRHAASSPLEQLPVHRNVAVSRPARVLVVEDDDDMRFFLKELLDEEGFETLSAEDALTGLMTILAEGADVVVTDWKMPAYDGMRLLESCRRVAPETPVVLVTGHAERGLAERVRELGGFSILLKPFITKSAETIYTSFNFPTPWAEVKYADGAELRSQPDDLRVTAELVDGNVKPLFPRIG